VCSPSWETVCPTQSLRKSPSRHKPDGTGRPEWATAEDEEDEEEDGTGAPWITDDEVRPLAHSRRTYGSGGKGSLCRNI